MAKERIHKIIANAGLASRRGAEKAILAGRVLVNGATAQIGQSADAETDKILFDDQLVRKPSEKTTIAFNKPRSVITTKSDPQGRKTVMDFLPDELKVNPVGRLDYNSEGLLLFTNDGELHNKLTHPSFKILKTYEVTVEGRPSLTTQARLLEGVTLKDGPGKFEDIKVLATDGKNTVLKIVVSEGRNRFIRRMMTFVDHEVVRLVRTKIGKLELGSIEPGQFTEISAESLV